MARRFIPSTRPIAMIGSALVFTGLTFLGGLGTASLAQVPKAAPQKADPHAEDRKAIRAAMTAFAAGFEARDAKALAALWTEGGEFTNAEGLTVRGRAALEAAFSKLLASSPDVKARVEPQTIRFLSKDVAIEEGRVVVRRGANGADAPVQYSALFVREDGHWRLAEMGESTDDAVSIHELDWLIGEWHSVDGQGAEIRTTYTWAPSKKFIHAQFSLKEKDLSLGGSQVIGVDPETGSLHSWTFDADGGVGEADWSPDGDHWVLEAAGTRADGTTLYETNILRRINNDTMTWQSVGRVLGDAPLADLAPVKITRVK